MTMAAKKTSSKANSLQQAPAGGEAPEQKVRNPNRNTVQAFVETAEKANMVPTDLQRSAVNAVYSAITGITTTIAIMALNDPDFEAVYADLKTKVERK
jgi:hypothetical protein